MAQSQMNNQTQMNITETNAQAGLEKAAMDNETKLALGMSRNNKPKQ
jgi:hypothetical protein